MAKSLFLVVQNNTILKWNVSKYKTEERFIKCHLLQILLRVKFLIHVVTQPLKPKFILKLAVLAVELFLQVLQLVNTKLLNYVMVIQSVSAARVF